MQRERVEREMEDIEDYSSDDLRRHMGARVPLVHDSASAIAVHGSENGARDEEDIQDEPERVAESSSPPARPLAIVSAARRAGRSATETSGAGAARSTVTLRPASTSGPSTSRAIVPARREQRQRRASANSDLLPPEGDFNTDDSLSDGHSSSEETQTQAQPAQRRSIQRALETSRAPTGPVRERRRQGIAARAMGPARHWRQMQLAAPGMGGAAAVEQRPALAAGPAAMHGAHGMRDASVGALDTGTAASNEEADANVAAEAPTSRRVKARKHPKKSNLVCPQCRTRVVIPPFPIFMLRELSDAAQVHANGRRLASVERERGEDVLEDTTWGELFPRAAA